jgi:hypothetical protein
MRTVLGDIWEWRPTSGDMIEYWLITDNDKAIGLCIYGESAGDVEEITVNDQNYLHHWKKVA